MSDDRVIVVSLDCHIDPASPDVIGAYLETKYQEDYQRSLQGLAEMAVRSRKDTEAAAANELPVFEEHYHRVRGRVIKIAFVGLGYQEVSYQHRLDSSQSFTADPDVRLKELEADGVVAEFLFSNGGIPFQSFG